MKCKRCRRAYAEAGEDLCLSCSRKELDKAVRRAGRKTRKAVRLNRKKGKR